MLSVLFALLCVTAITPCTWGVGIKISVDRTTFGIGQSCVVSVLVAGSINNTVVWPFVNGTQWGANPLTYSGSATILIPIPNAGMSTIVVGVVGNPPPSVGPFTVGLPLSAFGSGLSLSNQITVNVTNRVIRSPDPNRGFYVPMEWEPWFTPLNMQWVITEAIPIVGRYNSYNIDVIKQHLIWLNEAGVDSLMVDWTNNLWEKNHWSERNPDIQELVNCTTLMLETYTSLHVTSKIPVPKVVMLLGLDNGILATPTAVMEELDFMWDSYVTNKSISSDLWLIYEGKPLVVIFDGENLHPQMLVNETRFTVRWMSSQLQTNHLDQKGFWSWMDGSLAPIPTYYNGSVEALTVTPAFFAPGGWLAEGAYSRRSGATFIEQFKTAAKYPAKFLIINQWNEFAGQPNDVNSTSYVDTYSFSLSDDIEPTDLTICAYPRPGQQCKGWGFFYLNLMNALITLHQQGNNSRYTVLAIASPENGDVIQQKQLMVQWAYIGIPPKSYNVLIDDAVVAKVNGASNSTLLNISSFVNGGRYHVVTVQAVGAFSPYPLSYTQVDLEGQPMMPLQAVATNILFNF